MRAEKVRLSVVQSDLPEPPYPADTKANGYKIEVDWDRIRQSKTWVKADAEVRPWLLMIWLQSRENVPCGSWEDDEEYIARCIGCSPQFFAVHREILLCNWQLHSDGRMYHPYISKQVNQMLSRREKATARQRKSRSVTRDTPVTERDSQGTYAKEQEQEQESPPEIYRSATADLVPKSSISARAVRCPYTEIRDAYCEILPEKRQPHTVEQWTQARKDKIRRLWQDRLPDLESWRALFAYVRKSEFLMEGRFCDLFWISAPENLLKITEGKYHG